MRLLILNPEVAFRDCDECRRFVFDEKTGRPVIRRGEKVTRHPKCPPMCETSIGCPKGSPTGTPGCRELSPKNWAAYQHYRECLAVGEFPRDSIVRRNASIIRMAEESAKDAKSVNALGPLLSLFQQKGGQHGR